MDTFRRQPSGEAPFISRASTRRALGASGSIADASQYFSIETRLELKTRVTKLQSQLHQLLVQSKLAWMRSFTEPRTAASAAAVSQLVKLGEVLMTKLSRAFDLAAGTVTAPLPEYQALVSEVEAKMATFQHLIASMAQGNFPQPEGDLREEEDDNSAIEAEEEEEEEKVTYLHRPIHVDLPSMQTYCKHVAPPYSSYLPAKAKLSPSKT